MFNTFCSVDTLSTNGFILQSSVQHGLCFLIILVCPNFLLCLIHFGVRHRNFISAAVTLVLSFGFSLYSCRAHFRMSVKQEKLTKSTAYRLSLQLSTALWKRKGNERTASPFNYEVITYFITKGWLGISLEATVKSRFACLHVSSIKNYRSHTSNLNPGSHSRDCEEFWLLGFNAM
jgi:hypothetical protein